MDVWTLPAAAGVQVIEHREEIAKSWRVISRRLRADRVSVALTGMPGVGKSVLLDHLAGRDRGDAYRPPGESRLVERATRKANRLRVRLTAIPGQDTAVRVRALDDLFNTKRPIAGLIHVVANGYSFVRSEFARDHLESESDLATYLAQRREDEIDDLKVTLDYVRNGMRRSSGNPFWIIVVVNKADLFASAAEFTAAQRHYEDDGGFMNVLGDFSRRVGTDNVVWETRPTSVWPETFRWRGEEVLPQLSREQQLSMLLGLARAVEERSRS